LLILILFPLLLASLANVDLVPEVRDVLAGLIVHDVGPSAGPALLHGGQDIVFRTKLTGDMNLDRERSVTDFVQFEFFAAPLRLNELAGFEF
jgi:hypothetical protein